MNSMLCDSVPSSERVMVYRTNHITYNPQGNLLTLRRYAPTTSNPGGTTVDQLTYHYTARRS